MNADQLPEDSPDLTDAEVDGAFVTVNYGKLRESLIHLSCPSCTEGVPSPVKHSLRRRRPGLYWRIDLECQNGHKMTKTYRVDWLEPHGKQ